MAKIKLILILLSLPIIMYGQTNRYMVFLKDKANSSFSINQPSEFLSARAIERRINQGIAVVENDLPVNLSYIQEIKELGIDVFYSSKWLNSILIQTDENNINVIAALSFVDTVEFIAPNAKLSFNGRKFENEEEDEVQADNDFQNNLLGVDQLHNEAIFGENIQVAFFDGGFLGVNTHPAFDHLFTNNQLSYVYNFVENNENVYQASTHGTRAFSTVAAKIANEYKGVATDATFMLCMTEDVPTEFRIEEYNWLIAAEKTDSAGVDIISSSLGYNVFDDNTMNYTKADLDGQTTVITQAANFATSKGILVVVSAGNEGNKSWELVTPPADADKILAVGSVDSNRNRSDFSSIGPTADGRTKPDIMAFGEGTSLVNNVGIVSGNGTSFSAPQIAGFAALVWQVNPNLTNLELRRRILDMGSKRLSRDNQLGYGIPYYTEAITALNKTKPNNIKVFPNPMTSNQLSIQTNLSIENWHVSIINLAGQVVFNQKLQTNQSGIIQLELSDISEGTYLLKLQSNQHSYNTRIIKF